MQHGSHLELGIWRKDDERLGAATSFTHLNRAADRLLGLRRSAIN